jgi:carbamoyl-phosphate synthase small subunit
MTYPLIGNYGVILEDYESEKIRAKAVFIHEVAEFESNFRAKENLNKFLKDNNVPGLTNINTRKLTKILRNSGTMRGYMTSDISNVDNIINKIKQFKVERLVDIVTCKEQVKYGNPKAKQIALLDFGFKHNILNSLLKRNVGVTIYPANTRAEEILAAKPDGIVLSN